jgi:hypothetical protein
MFGHEVVSVFLRALTERHGHFFSFGMRAAETNVARTLQQQARLFGCLDQPPSRLNMKAMLRDTLAALTRMPTAVVQLRNGLAPRAHPTVENLEAAIRIPEPLRSYLLKTTLLSLTTHRFPHCFSRLSRPTPSTLPQKRLSTPLLPSVSHWHCSELKSKQCADVPTKPIRMRNCAFVTSTGSKSRNFGLHDQSTTCVPR